MDQITGYNSDEGSGGQGKTPPPEQKDQTQAPASQEAGTDVDDFGYKKVASEQGQTDTKTDTQAPPQEKPVETKVAGYGDEPPAVPEVKEDEKKTEEKKESSGFVIDNSDNLLLDDEVKELKAYIFDHKLSDDAAKAMVEWKRNEAKQLNEYVKERDRKSAETKRGWYEELKADPDFGGDKFSHNVGRVEKVIDQFMPSLKKKLTESKEMLPPYIMRDLAKLASHLYDSGSFVKGEPNEPKKNEPEENDPLAFYN